jgi:hypothetical protein
LVLLSISRREFLVCLRPNKRAASEQKLRELRAESCVLLAVKPRQCAGRGPDIVGKSVVSNKGVCFSCKALVVELFLYLSCKPWWLSVRTKSSKVLWTLVVPLYCKLS